MSDDFSQSYDDQDYDDDDTGQSPVQASRLADSGDWPPEPGQDRPEEANDQRPDDDGHSEGDDSVSDPARDRTDAALKAVHQYMPEAYANQDSLDDDDDRIGDEQFTPAYDIIEHMEKLVEEAKTGIFNSNVAKIDKSEFLDLLHELKKGLPVQLERASALMRESERRLENAQNQSNSIVSDARSQASGIIREANEQAQFLAGQENVVSIATQKASNILDQAQEKANQLTSGANAYATKSMNDLDEQVTEIHNSIVSGLEVLKQRQKEAESQVPRLSAEDYPDHQ